MLHISAFFAETIPGGMRNEGKRGREEAYLLGGGGSETAGGPVGAFRESEAELKAWAARPLASA